MLLEKEIFNLMEKEGSEESENGGDLEDDFLLLANDGVVPVKYIEGDEDQEDQKYGNFCLDQHTYIVRLRVKR